MTKHEFVSQLIPHRHAEIGTTAEAFAPVNIALAKYWGKRNRELNLPQNSSLSISLPEIGTHTRLTLIDGPDSVTLNGDPAPQQFAERLSAFLDLFRPEGCGFAVKTHNTVATAAGLASSASGFAAAVKALDALFQWQLDARTLSMLARIGSGSASRSLYSGFALWHKGMRDDGLDSFAEGLSETWPALRIGFLEVTHRQKPISSTAGMQQTVNHCPLYTSWPPFAEESVHKIRRAITTQTLTELGQLTEHNALTMHATMIATQPPVLYWQPESIIMMQAVWAVRAEGLPVWLTMDAGPNLKLIFEVSAEEVLLERFPQLKVFTPFPCSVD